MATASGADHALLVLVTAVWGVNFVSAKLGLAATTPLGFRALTFGGGAALLVALGLVTRAPLRLPRTRDYVHLFVAGLFSIAAFGVLAAVAVLHSGAGRTSIVVYTMPLWVAVLSHFVLGERLGAQRLIAVGLGTVGILVLLIPLFAAGLSLGSLAALGSAVCWAVGTIWLKGARVEARPIAITIWQLLAGTVVLVAAVLLAGDPVFTGTPSRTAWFGIAYTTVAGTVVAYLIWFPVVQRLPASVAGMGTLLVPVFGTFAGIVFLGERLTLADAAGFALILAAGLLALKPPKAEAPPTVNG